MRNLFLFIYRIRVFVLFLLLESVAFIWIFNSRSYQRSAFVNSANEFTGSILTKTNSMEEYLELADQNERLARENARLRSLSRSSFLDLSSETEEINDPRYQTRFTYQEGQVISSSFRKARNFMTINRGRIHGLKEGMGVISSQGIVGAVDEVSEHFATVIPVINSSFSVSGKIKDSDFFGPVQWNNSDYRFAYLVDIPRYAKLKQGDTVITDARSRIFPEGIDIGYLEAYELQEDQNFFSVKLWLATDFSAINYVYIIEDRMKGEIEELQNRQGPQ